MKSFNSTHRLAAAFSCRLTDLSIPASWRRLAIDSGRS
jgi:hypothetical protein